MGLIAKYLKPFTMTLTLCLALLLVQALSELSLPNLMSDLVNTGIQSGGISSDAPEILPEEGMDLLTLYMTEEDRETFQSNYKKYEAGKAPANVIDEFPEAANRSVYVLDGDGTHGVYPRSVYAMMLSLSSFGKGGGQDKGVPDLTPLYEMTPALEKMAAAGEFKDEIKAAKESDSQTATAVAPTFTRLFYGDLGADLKAMQMHYIFMKGMEMLGVALLAGAMSVGVGYFSTLIATTVAKRVRKDVFSKVISFSNSEYDQFSAASLITRSTNDVQQVQVLIIMGIRMICYAPILGVGGIIMALRTNVSMSWVIAVAVGALLILVGGILATALPKFKILQKLIDRVNLISRENLSGLMVVRTFGNERFEEKRFEQANDTLRRTNRFIQRTMAFLFPAMMLLMNGVTLLIVWVGAHSIAESNLQIGDMMAFMQYAMQIIMAFLMLSMMFIMVPRALVSANRIKEVMNTDLTIKDQPTVSTPQLTGEVAFDNVTFSYPRAEEPVLENISFTAQPGKTTAIIGSTGSGKSTLVQLIPRLYDVSEGMVNVNGVDVREQSQEQLRDEIGYVPQKGFLFTGDIRSNIQYGNLEATDEDIWNALRVAQAEDFVKAFDKGLDTEISQGGTNVSGGQRQRLAIARALLKKPKIYLFDDSFSALDVKTDAALRKALRQEVADATVIIVAQRVSTIQQADQIIVLDEGRIAGIGTHAELLATCAPYQEIVESQVAKEDL